MNRAGAEVLLVDDSVDDVELAVNALSAYWPAERITTVHDGAEARDYLYCRGKYANRPRVNPALILLDIKMPKVDGLDVLRTIKNDQQLKTIPVVMLSSSREERDVNDSYRSGSNAYVVKPLVFAEFHAAINKLGAFWLATNELPTSNA
jgi:CheY-like chemotaxis protein